MNAAKDRVSAMSDTPIRITTPLDEETVLSLRAGQPVLISGAIYTARDAAHRRMAEALARDEELPFDIRGQIIYYVGPTPPPPGRAIGAAGPTTAGRMDAYVPQLVSLGLKGMIGKGPRSEAVKAALQQYKAVYFGAIGGAGAYLAQRIKSAELIAYEDLGTEAIRRLVAEDFPAIVINDCHGGDAYEQGRAQWRRERGG
jgi:fumarate hydratase subunit beta